MDDNIIISNQVQCLRCGDTPYSARRHDFVSCTCGAVAVDGGQDYLKRVGEPQYRRDLSISMGADTVAAVLDAIDEAKASGRNSFGIACAVIRTLRDHGQLTGVNTPLDWSDGERPKAEVTPTPVDPGARNLELGE